MTNKKLLQSLALSTLTSMFCCSFTNAATSPQATTQQPTSPKVILPQPNKQCDADCIQYVQNTLDAYRKASNVPGIQLTINFFQQPMQTFSSGTITKNGNIPIDKNTKFEIGSTTKSFTAAIALQLEEQGKFNLSDKIGKWFGDEYPAWKDNTVSNLLNMTSTTLDYFDGDFGKFQATYEKDPTHIWTTKELTDWVYKSGPLCSRTNKLTPFCAEKPGQGWSYSNTNYILLERIIEKTTNKSLQNLMPQRIFKPLKLSNTIYASEQNPINLKNFAHAYNNEPTSSAYGKDVTNFSLSAARGAGAIVATTADLAKWVQALFTGKVLSSQQMAKMTSGVCTTDGKDCKAGQPVPTNSSQTSYSCGLLKVVDQNTKRTLWIHTGGSEGHATIFIYDPKNNFVITIAQNMIPSSPTPAELGSKLAKYLVERK